LNRKNQSRLEKLGDKDARAAIFMMERVAGSTYTDIAKRYNCSLATVAKYLDYARETNLVLLEAQRHIGKSLVPLALAVYELELKAGNLDAARDILYGASILSKTATVRHEPSDAEQTLESFRSEFFKAKTAHAIDATPIVGDPTPAPDSLFAPPPTTPDESK
jgi:transposase-like protein